MTPPTPHTRLRGLLAAAFRTFRTFRVPRAGPRNPRYEISWPSMFYTQTLPSPWLLKFIRRSVITKVSIILPIFKTSLNVTAKSMEQSSYPYKVFHLISPSLRWYSSYWPFCLGFHFAPGTTFTLAFAKHSASSLPSGIGYFR